MGLVIGLCYGIYNLKSWPILNKEPTIDVAPVQQWLEVLTGLGAERIKLLQSLGCDDSFLSKRDNRIATRCHHAMLHTAASEIDLPGIILLAGSKTSAQSMGVVGHLMMNCETLLDAGLQLVRYASVLSETGNWRIDKNQDGYDIRYQKTNHSETYPEIEEATLASCIGVLRTLSGKQIIPQEIHFTHADPGYASVYENVFLRPVNFDSNECLIRIGNDDATLPIGNAQPYVQELLESHAQELLEKMRESDSISSKAGVLITKHLAEGTVNIESISAQLFMSRWTLTRHLKQEGVTFNDLVRDIRSQLAQTYLFDKNLSISEVGFLLGYSEVSAFQRAFRNWHQCTPSEYRTNH